MTSTVKLFLIPLLVTMSLPAYAFCEFRFQADEGQRYVEREFSTFLEREIRKRISRKKDYFNVYIYADCDGNNHKMELGMVSDTLYILSINGIELSADVVRYSNNNIEVSRKEIDNLVALASEFDQLSKPEQQQILKMFAFIVAEAARFSVIEGAMLSVLNQDCVYQWKDFSRLVRRWKTLSIFSNTRGIATGEQYVGGSRAFLIVPITNNMIRQYNRAVSSGWKVTRRNYNERVTDSAISTALGSCP